MQRNNVLMLAGLMSLAAAAPLGNMALVPSRPGIPFGEGTKRTKGRRAHSQRVRANRRKAKLTSKRGK